MSIWAQNLQKTVEQKAIKKLKNKGEIVQMLRVNLANADNIIKNICKANQKKRLFTLVNQWVSNI